MKIGFAGAHRTGKTSLAERLAVDHDLIMYYTNVSSVFNKEENQMREMETVKGRYAYRERILIQEQALTQVINTIVRGEDQSIFDRTPLDVWAYSEYFLTSLINTFPHEKWEREALDNHRQIILNRLEAIDFYFIIQTGIPFVSAEKSGSLDYQQDINDNIVFAAEKFLRPNQYFIMPADITDFNERIAVCEDVMRVKKIIK